MPTIPPDPSERPVDEVLRQAVLANMRGQAELLFEYDFPPGSHMIGEINDGQKAGERVEFDFSHD